MSRLPPVLAARPARGFEYRGRTALITGASSGLGEAFARELAARGMNLLLTALPQDAARLHEVVEDLHARHGTRVEQVLIDLTETGAARKLQELADQRGVEPDLLVNNAGMGLLGSFVSLPLERQLAMLRLNADVVLELTGLYLPRMVGRRNGAILNVASTAAFDPLPYLAVYAASKAFVLRFIEALWAESHRAGVRVVAFCPGPVADTQFGTRGEPDAKGDQRFRPGLRRAAVVATALRALERDQPRALRRVPVFAQLYGLVTVAQSLLPHRARLLLAERLSRWYFRL